MADEDVTNKSGIYSYLLSGEEKHLNVRAFGDPFAQVAYVFSNRRRDRVKILLWDRNGFWLLIKRLESSQSLHALLRF